MDRKRVFLVGVVGCAVVVPACGNRAAPACMSAGDDGGLAAEAAAFELEVYAASVGCDGTQVAHGTSVPIATYRFAAGGRPQIALPPSGATLALTAFADAAGTRAIGAACEARVTPSGDRCVALVLAPLDVAPADMGALDGGDLAQPPDLTMPIDGAPLPDLSMPVDSATAPDLACSAAGCPCTSAADCPSVAPRCSSDGKCVQCLPASDNCPTAQWCAPDDTCQPGCKSDADCPGGRCDLASHLCVGCLVDGDCPAGTWCSAGTCLPGCDLAGGRGCATGLTCCGHSCVDTTSSTAACGGCGIACGAGQSCCAGRCTSTAIDIDNCGGCGLVCAIANGTPSCTSGACTWSCATGFAHCSTANTGCECATPGCCGTACETTHSDGLGDAFYDCAPLASYDAAQATEACAAWTGNAAQCAQQSCGAGAKAVCSVGAAACACWVYQGQNQGRVQASSTTTCACPGGGSPRWQ